MKELYRDFLKAVDGNRLMRHTGELWKCEFGQTFQDYHKAAEYTYDLMKKEGIPNAELLYYPADGKTTYNDIRMPIAWDATVGRLTFLSPIDLPPPPAFEKDADSLTRIDFQLHPFHLIKGSVATPPGGLVVRIITETQFLAGEDPAGALVMLDPFTMPRAEALVPILDCGGLGVITDKNGNRYEHPDCMSWVNAGTEDGSWHVLAGHRDFISFSVSLSAGDRIRNIATHRELKALVECDGRRYEGKLPAVTALIPGRRKEEVWIYAHMYEPLSGDDPNGVVGGIEAARLMMQRGVPEFSIRLLFAMELYGYMAYIAERGSFLRNEVIGGCNFDALASVKNAKTSNVYTAGRGSPFYGNWLAGQLVGELENEPGALRWIMKGPAYFDDDSFSDSTIGIPAVWAIGEFGDNHHSSIQTMDFLDESVFVRGTAFNTAFVHAVANPKEAYLAPALEQALRSLRATLAELKTNPLGSDAERFAHLYEVERRHLADFKRGLAAGPVEEILSRFEAEYRKLSAGLSADPEPPSKWRKHAAGIVMKRAVPGFPHNLVKVPPDKKILLPDGVIYGPFSNVLANMDGKKDVAVLIREAEYERNSRLSEGNVKKYVDALNFLSDYGYLAVEKRPDLTEEEIVAALRKLGIGEGDLLLVHAATSRCGYVRGGAETVLSAIRKAVGKTGTALFPTFTRPYIYLGGLNKGWNYRPFDPSSVSQIWTGNIPKILLEKCSDALRSRHITHSWAGFGPAAEECLKHHGAYAPPASPASPMGKALECKGKILHFGSGIGSTTFLHYLEDHCNAPFLDTAVCRVKNPDGTLKTVAIEKHLPGHRDFYREDAEKCKFFRRAVERGLEIRSEPLGVGELKVMEMESVFSLGIHLMKDDPRVLLCDDPGCLFCRRYQ
ncbi:MAG: Aminoglycoside 3-N-acetyltransferase [Lentisphaerae bacterium ADurb.Bin242]|nr:MAG: Aminoglycoside 3-N-acetyltransferase [Lentisphaerae bacterium ADurb.Bin242]